MALSSNCEGSCVCERKWVGRLSSFECVSVCVWLGGLFWGVGLYCLVLMPAFFECVFVFEMQAAPYDIS